MKVVVRNKTINKYEQDEQTIWVVYETRGDDPWIALYDSARRSDAYQYAKKLRNHHPVAFRSNHE